MVKVTTGERLMRLETQMDDVKELLKDMKEEQCKTNAKLDTLDNKYANKWVEKGMLTLLGLFVTTFIAFLIYIL